MKLIKITSMMAVAVAAGFCMSVNATVPAGEGKNGNLELTAPATKVNVTTSAATGGSWNTRPDTEGAYFVIDCDAATSNQFHATETSNKIVKCAFTLKPAPVPYTVSLPAPDASAQVAFCIATNTTSGGAATLNAYVSGGWTALTGTIPSVEYTLTITFDYTGATKYAKFAIGDDDLTNGGEKWFPIADPNATGVKDYCFIGSGDLKSILTTGQDVTAEQETIGGHTIGIPEEVVSQIGNGSSSAAATELAKTSDVNGLTMLDNYVIFGLDDNGIREVAKPVAKAATSITNGGIKLNFTNVAANEVSGTTIKYTLKGKTRSSDDSWSTVVGPTTDKEAMVIPSSTSYRIFKVEVTVEK